MKIIKITEGFVTNSSSYSGNMIIAVRKGKDLKNLLRNVGLGEFVTRFNNLENQEIL